MNNFIKVQLSDGTEAVINKLTITKIVANQRGTLTILFNGLGSNGFPQSHIAFLVLLAGWYPQFPKR